MLPSDRLHARLAGHQRVHGHTGASVFTGMREGKWKDVKPNNKVRCGDIDSLVRGCEASNSGYISTF